MWRGRNWSSVGKEDLKFAKDKFVTMMTCTITLPSLEIRILQPAGQQQGAMEALTIQVVALGMCQNQTGQRLPLSEEGRWIVPATPLYQMSSPKSLQTSPLDVPSLSCQNADGYKKIIILKFSMPIFWGIWCWRPTDNHTFQKKKILKGKGPKELSPCFPGTKAQSISNSHCPLSRGGSLTFLRVCVCVCVCVC